MPTRNEFLDDAMTKKVQLKRVVGVYLVALASIYVVNAQPTVATAAGPVRHADFVPDYEASGFVSPAGMPSPEAYFASVEQAGFFGNGPVASRLGGGQGMMNYGPMATSCDTSGYGGCGPGGCGPGGCGPGGCGCGQGGCLMGDCGCGARGLFAGGYRPMCLFCGSSGCGVCNGIASFSPLAALRYLMPYGAAGLSAQRWYDISGDVMFLETSGGGGGQVLTTLGPAGVPVLRTDDANDDGYTVGGRLSAAFIVGPGGNIEVTYLGGNRWKDSATVTGAGNLFSFLSDFGTAPVNGFDDSDRSDRQSAATQALFHSGEVNYRRRTVGPYGRFQWSGLGGIRYLRYDNDFSYSTFAADAPENRFLDMQNMMDNELVGVQAGGDLWWNVIPGVNVGIGVKGGPMGNRIKRNSFVAANSVGPGATPGSITVADRATRSAWMGEVEATLLYRISHSWTLKTQYYLLAVDEIGFGFDPTAANRLLNGGATPIDPIQTRSLTISGFSIGAEYMW
jgi:hypothetical protein